MFPSICYNIDGRNDVCCEFVGRNQTKKSCFLEHNDIATICTFLWICWEKTVEVKHQLLLGISKLILMTGI